VAGGLPANLGRIMKNEWRETGVLAAGWGWVGAVGRAPRPGRSRRDWRQHPTLDMRDCADTADGEGFDGNWSESSHVLAQGLQVREVAADAELWLSFGPSRRR
jgi:hypothetical protein